MQAIQSNKIVRLQKVSIFFSSRTISNQPTGLADQLTALANAIAGTQDAAKVQADSTDYLSRQTKTVRQLRQALHDDHLLPLYHSAVALNKEVPNLLSHFKIPKATLRESMYVADLDAILGRATEFQAQFIAHGAPADFVTSLGTAITNYKSTVDARESAMQNRVKAREALKVSLTAGGDAVRHLNAMVVRIYGNDPATLAAWQQARHLEHLASRQKSTAAGTAPGASMAPGASTAPEAAGVTPAARAA